jgi:hypothetical protein
LKSKCIGVKYPEALPCFTFIPLQYISGKTCAVAMLINENRENSNDILTIGQYKRLNQEMAFFMDLTL